MFVSLFVYKMYAETPKVFQEIPFSYFSLCVLEPGAD